MSAPGIQSEHGPERETPSGLAVAAGVLASFCFTSGGHAARQDSQDPAAQESRITVPAGDSPKQSALEFPSQWFDPSRGWHPPLLPPEELLPDTQPPKDIDPKPDPAAQGLMPTKEMEKLEGLTAAPPAPDGSAELRRIIKEELGSFGKVQLSSPAPSTDELRDMIRSEVKAAVAELDESHRGSWTWKAITLGTTAIALLSFWRWRYRTKDDFKRKEADLSDTFKWYHTIIERPKFISVSDRQPKKSGEVRQLVVGTMAMGGDQDADLETIVGPYNSYVLKKAVRYCTPEDPFILDHIGKVRIPFAWIRDEFFRGEFRAAARLLKERIQGAPAAEKEVINARLKRAVENTYGTQAIEFLEGKDRDPQYYLVAVLCDVSAATKRGEKPLRRIMPRVISDEQLPLYRNPEILAQMLEFNPDERMQSEIRLMARLSEREKDHQPPVRPAKLKFQPGHPRIEKPGVMYAQYAEIIHRDIEGKPVDPARIREYYGKKPQS